MAGGKGIGWKAIVREGLRKMKEPSPADDDGAMTGKRAAGMVRDVEDAGLDGTIGGEVGIVVRAFERRVEAAGDGAGWSAGAEMAEIVRVADGLRSVADLPAQAREALDAIWAAYGMELARVRFQEERSAAEEGVVLARWLQEMIEEWDDEDWSREEGIAAVLRRSRVLLETGEVRDDDRVTMERAFRKYAGELARARCRWSETSREAAELKAEIRTVKEKAGVREWGPEERSYADIPGMAGVMRRVDGLVRRGGLGFGDHQELEEERVRWARDVRMKAERDADVAAGMADAGVADREKGEPGGLAAAGGCEVKDPEPSPPPAVDPPCPPDPAGRPKAAEVNAWLMDRVEDVCRHYLPAGKRSGDYWTAGSVDGDPGNCLWVHLSGRKRGNWADMETGEQGDLLDLIKRVRVLPGIGDAMKEALAFLVIGGASPSAEPSRKDAGQDVPATPGEPLLPVAAGRRASTEAEMGAARAADKVRVRLGWRAEEVCRHYLPDGKRSGGYWTGVTLDGDPGDSLWVHLGGRWRGRWRDPVSDERGDLLDLIKRVRALPSIEAAVIEAEKFLAREMAGEPHPPPVPAAKKAAEIVDDYLDDIPF